MLDNDPIALGQLEQTLATFDVELPERPATALRRVAHRSGDGLARTIRRDPCRHVRRDAPPVSCSTVRRESDLTPPQGELDTRRRRRTGSTAGWRRVHALVTFVIAASLLVVLAGPDSLLLLRSRTAAGGTHRPRGLGGGGRAGVIAAAPRQSHPLHGAARRCDSSAPPTW